MKTLSLALFGLAAFLLSSRASAQVPIPTEYYVFKISATIPCSIVVPPADIEGYDKIVKRTFKTNDLINMALGQPLTTKIDPKHPVYLALATTFEDHQVTPASKIVIYDPAASGAARFKTTVMTLTTLDYINAQGPKRNGGSGVGTGKFVAATLGEPAKYGLLQTEFAGSGLASGPYSTFVDLPGMGRTQVPRPSVGTAAIQGRLKFNMTDAGGTTTVYDGLFTKASFVLSAKLLGVVEE